MAPSYQKLRTMVRGHIGQTTRTRNFKARSERIETGVWVKSHTESNVIAERQVGDCVSGRQMDSVRKEIPVVSSTGFVLVKEHNHPLLLRRQRLRLKEESLTCFALHEERVILD